MDETVLETLTAELAPCGCDGSQCKVEEEFFPGNPFLFAKSISPCRSVMVECGALCTCKSFLCKNQQIRSSGYLKTPIEDTGNGITCVARTGIPAGYVVFVFNDERVPGADTCIKTQTLVEYELRDSYPFADRSIVSNEDDDTHLTTSCISASGVGFKVIRMRANAPSTHPATRAFRVPHSCNYNVVPGAITSDGVTRACLIACRKIENGEPITQEKICTTTDRKKAAEVRCSCPAPADWDEQRDGKYEGFPLYVYQEPPFELLTTPDPRAPDEKTIPAIIIPQLRFNEAVLVHIWEEEKEGGGLDVFDRVALSTNGIKFAAGVPRWLQRYAARLLLVRAIDAVYSDAMVQLVTKFVDFYMCFRKKPDDDGTMPFAVSGSTIQAHDLQLFAALVTPIIIRNSMDDAAGPLVPDYGEIIRMATVLSPSPNHREMYKDVSTNVDNARNAMRNWGATLDSTMRATLMSATGFSESPVARSVIGTAVVPATERKDDQIRAHNMPSRFAAHMINHSRHGPVYNVLVPRAFLGPGLPAVWTQYPLAPGERESRAGREARIVCISRELAAVGVIDFGTRSAVLCLPADTETTGITKAVCKGCSLSSQRHSIMDHLFANVKTRFNQIAQNAQIEGFIPLADVLDGTTHKKRARELADDKSAEIAAFFDPIRSRFEATRTSVVFGGRTDESFERAVGAAVWIAFNRYSPNGEFWSISDVLSDTSLPFQSSAGKYDHRVLLWPETPVGRKAFLPF